MEKIRNKYGLPLHYYGDNVRQLLLVASVIMIATLPFLSSRLPVSTVWSIVVIVLLCLSAGFLAPRKKLAIILNLLISIGGFAVFEYTAVDTYSRFESVTDMLFMINQVLALVFLFALYYSAKTFRSILKN
jgi:hypothetical protein